MDSIIRAVIVYAVLLLLFRMAGRRTLAQMTSFDIVLLLIVSEAVQNALIRNDYSLTNAFLIVMTLIGLDIGLSVWKQRSPRLDRWLDGAPTIVVVEGRPLKDRMDRARIDEADILMAARATQGLERMEQIKYAVLEHSGGISIVPKASGQ